MEDQVGRGLDDCGLLTRLVAYSGVEEVVVAVLEVVERIFDQVNFSVHSFLLQSLDQ